MDEDLSQPQNSSEDQSPIAEKANGYDSVTVSSQPLEAGDFAASAEEQIRLDGIQSLVQDNLKDIEDAIYNRDSDGDAELEMASERLSTLLRNAPGMVSGGFTYLLEMARLSKERTESQQTMLQNQNALEEKKKEQREQEQDRIDDMDDAFNQRHNVNQSYEEWLDTDQAFGDVHLTGQGWQTLQNWLKNKDNRQKTEEKLKEDGYTADEIAKAMRVIEVMAKHPSQWTDAEREFIRQQEKDKRVQAATQAAKTYAEDRGVDFSRSQTQSSIADKDNSTEIGQNITEQDQINQDFILPSANEIASATQTVEIMSKSPGEQTDKEREFIKYQEQDERIQTAVEQVREYAESKGVPLDSAASPDTSSQLATRISVAATIDDSFGSGAPAMRPAFANAANTNTASPESPKQVASATPPKVAANVVMDSGFS